MTKEEILKNCGFYFNSTDTQNIVNAMDIYATQEKKAYAREMVEKFRSDWIDKKEHIGMTYLCQWLTENNLNE